MAAAVGPGRTRPRPDSSVELDVRMVVAFEFAERQPEDCRKARIPREPVVRRRKRLSGFLRPNVRAVTRVGRPPHLNGDDGARDP